MTAPLHNRTKSRSVKVKGRELLLRARAFLMCPGALLATCRFPMTDSSRGPKSLGRLLRGVSFAPCGFAAIPLGRVFITVRGGDCPLGIVLFALCESEPTGAVVERRTPVGGTPAATGWETVTGSCSRSCRLTPILSDASAREGFSSRLLSSITSRMMASLITLERNAHPIDNALKQRILMFRGMPSL